MVEIELEQCIFVGDILKRKRRKIVYSCICGYARGLFWTFMSFGVHATVVFIEIVLKGLCGGE